MSSSPPFRLTPYRGGLALTGPGLSAAAAVHTSELPSSFSSASPSLHIILLTKEEYEHSNCPSPPIIDPSHLHVLGLGGRPSAEKEGSCWLVVVWNHANQWRRSVGLVPKQFYIILDDVEADDSQEVDRGITSLIGGDEGVKEVFRGLSEDGMDQVLASPPTRLVRSPNSTLFSP